MDNRALKDNLVSQALRGRWEIEEARERQGALDLQEIGEVLALLDQVALRAHLALQVPQDRTVKREPVEHQARSVNPDRLAVRVLPVRKDRRESLVALDSRVP
jgi:hypothetical protein